MFENLSREEIDTRVVRNIGRPKACDAAVKVVELDGRRAIFKDMSAASPLFRLLIGRKLIAREFAVYKALEGLEGVPRPCRMVGRDGFLVEYVSSSPIRRRDIRKGHTVPPEFYDRWMRLVREMHERGVLHFDLRNRKNFLLGEDGRVYIVDFASAVRIPWWLPFRKRITRWLGVFDRAGLLKMKRLLSPEQMTAEEQRFLERFELWRSVLFPPALIRRLLRRRRRAKERGSDGEDNGQPNGHR